MATPVARESECHLKNVMRTLRSNTETCDFVVEVGEERFSTQRIILTACSDYFKAMLSHDTKESRDGVVIMSEVHPEAVRECIDFMYSGKVSFSIDTVQGLLHAAGIMQLSELMQMCFAFLQEKLEPGNCIYVRSLASTYNCKELETAAETVILENFEAVIGTDDFCHLSEDDALRYMRFFSKKQNLKSQTEELKWNGVLHWIKHDETRRKNALVAFMKLIKITNLSTEFIKKNLLPEPLITSSHECKDLLLDQLCDDRRRKITKQDRSCQILLDLTAKQKIEKDLAARREELTPCLAAFNGNIGLVQGLALAKTAQWRRLFRTPIAGHYQIIAITTNIYLVTNHSIIHLGNDGRVLREVEVKISGLCRSVVFNDCIYVVNGVAKMLCYNPVRGASSNRQCCQQESCFCLAATGEFIYALGGGTYESYRNAYSYTKKATEYNPITNTWHSISNMNYARIDAAAAAHGKKIYVCGGSRRGKLNNVECYDPDSNVWTNVANMNTPRSRFSASVSNGTIYVVGGNDTGPQDAVEMYDVKNDKWTALQCPLQINDTTTSCIIFK